MRNKVDRTPLRPTPTITLAWEHPFPVGIVYNIWTKVPQIQRCAPRQKTTAMPPHQLPSHQCQPLSAWACIQPRA